MKVLYVTNFWSGFADIVKNGLEEPKGMPGFNLPLKKLIEQGVKVDFVVLSYQEQSVRETASWLSNSEFHFINGLGFANLNRLRALIASKEYDFVYGHGCKPAFWANIFSNIYGIPFGARLYGTFMGEVIESNLLKAILKHPYEFALYNLSKKFLLTTDDGTKGNKALERFRMSNCKYDFHFWINGIDVQEQCDEIVVNDLSKPYLFFPARFDRWKRQDMAIEIVKTLKNRGVNVQLLLCGHYFDQVYVRELEQQVAQNNLEGLVSMQESMPKDQLYQNMQQATAMLFCYDFSNFGNVFIESSSLGALNVVRNDNSCDRVMSDGVTGILFDTIEQAADGIQSVIEGHIDSQLLRHNCKIKASEVFSTWEKRVSDEIELINTYSRCETENKLWS